MRPKLRRFGTHEEALAAVDEILSHEAEVGASLGTIGEDEGSESDGEEEERRRDRGGGTDGDQSSSSSNVRGAPIGRSLSDVSDFSDDGRG